MNTVIIDAEEELKHAIKTHPPFLSAHEGLCVIWEEFEELKLEVFKRKSQRSTELMRKEALHLAAMAMRFVLDVVDGGTWRKDGA